MNKSFHQLNSEVFPNNLFLYLSLNWILLVSGRNEIGQKHNPNQAETPKHNKSFVACFSPPFHPTFSPSIISHNNLLIYYYFRNHLPFSVLPVHFLGSFVPPLLFSLQTDVPFCRQSACVSLCLLPSLPQMSS